MSTTSHRVAVARDPSSFVLRRVLPLTVATVVATGVLRWFATKHGLIPEAAGVILMTALAVAICTGYSLWLARTLRESTASQRDAERDALYRLVASNIPDGAVFTVAPTFDEKGDIVGGLVHSQQITERKQLEEQLHQSQKLEAVGSLAGGVAHDFNNLLTVISGHTSMLLGRAGEADPNREGLEEIALAAERAAGLTQQLLAFSRRQLLRPQPLDVNDVVDRLVPMLRALVEERIEIVTESVGALPQVMFDRGRLEQVIVNLVVNARDSIANAGRIVIETGERILDADYVAAHTDARLGPHVMLAVSDTGSGIDGETLERIFEPFFTTKEVGEGTGLGLSTVHGIVKQSGGNIWVYSERGHGTTFRVYIPVATENAIDTHLPDNLPAHTLRPAGGETVLVVEDHEGVLVLTKRVLEDAGYKVIAARSVDAAAELIAEHAIDVVLTDLVMPGGTGEQIADAVDARGLNPPVIYMSGYTEATASRDGLLLNGAAFLEKPFTPSALLSAVAGVFTS